MTINPARLSLDQQIRFNASHQPRMEAMMGRIKEKGVWYARLGGELVKANNLPELSQGLIDIALRR